MIYCNFIGMYFVNFYLAIIQNGTISYYTFIY